MRIAREFVHERKKEEGGFGIGTWREKENHRSKQEHTNGGKQQNTVSVCVRQGTLVWDHLQPFSTNPTASIRI